MATQRLCEEMTPNFARENETPSQFIPRPITSLHVDAKPQTRALIISTGLC